MSFVRGAFKRGGFPKPEDGPVDMPGRHTREGWTEVREHDSIYLGSKQYRNMKEWSRPCAICGSRFSAFEKVGQVDANSRFSNRTCEAHRGLTTAFDKGFLAWDAQNGVMVPGIKCAAAGTEQLLTRLKEAEDGAAAVAQQAGGVRKAIHEELGLSYIGDAISYDTVKAAIRTLKGEHELTSAVKQAGEVAEPPKQEVVTVQSSFDPHAALAAAIAAENKMPWQ